MLAVIGDEQAAMPIRKRPKDFVQLRILNARASFRVRNGADASVRTGDCDFARRRQRRVASGDANSDCDGQDQEGAHRPNENKMSEGGRGRASLGVELWKSSQNVDAERSAVRSIVWLGLGGLRK